MKSSIENILFRAQAVVPAALVMMALAPACIATSEEKANLPSDTSSEVRQLREQLAEQAKRIDRLYEALEPQLQEMEARAAELKKQQAEDAQLKLETVCTLVDQNLTSLAQFSPRENSFAVITRKRSVQIFTTEGQRVQELAPLDMKVNAIAYAPDGQRLLAGTQDGKVLLWNFTKGATQKVFTNIAGMVGRVAWLANPDRGVATTDLMSRNANTTNQTGYVFGLASGTLLAKFSSAFIRDDFQTLATSPDGKLIGALELPGQGRAGFLLDSEQCRIKAKLWDEEYPSGPLSIAIAPDNRTAAVGYAPYNLSLWDGAQQKELRLVKAHHNWVTSLGFSPDSKRLISGGGDSTARIWEVATGKEIGRIRFVGESTYVNSVGFSPDGKLILAAAQNDVLVVAKAPQ